MLPESDGSAVNGSVSQNQTTTIGGRDGRPDREPGRPGINRRSFLRAAGVSVIVAAGWGLAACSSDSSGDSAEQSSGANQKGSNGKDSRVAAVGMGDGDTLIALGIIPVITTSYGVQPKALNSWTSEALQSRKIHDLPIVLDSTQEAFSTSVLETIAHKNPSLIVAINTAVDKEAHQRLSAIAPIATHSDKYQDYEIPWDEQIKEVCKAVDREGDASKLIDGAKESFKKYRDKHTDIQNKKAAIVMPYDGKVAVYDDSAGRGQFITNMGYTIPQSVQGDGSGGQSSAFYHEISAENYDIFRGLDKLFVIDYAGKSEAFLHDPVFSSLDVAQEGRTQVLQEELGTAMSMPNPLSVPWALSKIE
ncbi:ABC transporter substrate-binding protein [Corynebacterium parakroppenstedtii]|uniref:ABC transporter substrate-binding protein n=1 Tax=Corynebacterium parakroppenstedtii TaxID=2828363 RepID=UPI0030EC89BE